MKKYRVVFYCYDDGVSEEIDLEEIDLETAKETAEEETEDWLRKGDWGKDGACVRGVWTLYDADSDEELAEEAITVDIEPNHEAKIRRATRGYESVCGLEPDDHLWTSDGEGGCDSNPGVFGHGGTAMSFEDHCRLCGLHRVIHDPGSQRNPDDHKTVEYLMLSETEIATHRANGDMD